MMQMMQMKSVIRGVSRDKALRVTAFHALAICFALITFAPAAKAFQDPQDGGPRVETQSPGYSQNSGSQADSEADSYPQRGTSQDHDEAQFPAARSEVARISLLHGEISMQRGDTGDWSTATLNTPLVRGDQVATGEKSRAEIQLDYADILRLSAHSQAKIADLTRTRIQLQIAQGYASYSMFKGGEADVEIDTPNVSVRPLRKGRYRVQVNSDSETEVIVREGEAEVTTPQGSTTVKQGQVITIRGTSNPEYRVDSAPPKDDWDRFNKDRDNEIRDAASWHRTNPYYTGANDLDANGRWVFIPGYGWVWQPYQDTGWAPYRAGRWVYEPYWGWTWVSYEPWGWAPYHYGRWFFWGASWVWWPGPVYPLYRPIWAPAYVSFIGFGHGVGFGFGFGSIGWLPCGPHDYFYPWYGRGFNRVNVVNITNINVINVRNDFRIRPLAIRGRQPFGSNVNLALTNPRVRAGISGLPAGEFGRGNVQVSRLNVREADLRESRVVTGNVPVVPTRESLHTGAQTRLGEGGVQPRNTDRFFTRRQPPAAAPAFHEQVNQVQRVMQGRIGNAQIPNTSGGKTPMGNTPLGKQESPVGGNRGAEINSPRSQPGPGRDAGNESRGIGGGGNPERKPGPEASGAPQGNADNSANRDHGGWTRFGSPSSRANDSGRSNSQPSGPSGPREGPADRVRGDRGSERGVDRGADHSVDGNNGGWKRFPSNSGPGSRENDGRQNDVPGGGDRSSGPRSKPTLELNKPIVTPRGTPGPSPSRGPEMHDERGGPPPSISRGEEPRGGPSERGAVGGGHERGGGGARGGGGHGSHERGGGARGGSGGGDRGSKSGSSPKSR